MIPLKDRLIVRWIPTTKVGLIHMPQSAQDFHNSDSVNMFHVVAAGRGRHTRKGIFVENEIKPGDKVIVDARVGNRPQELEDGTFLIANPSEAVIAVCPVQAST